MNGIGRINRDAAEKLFARFAPLFAELENRGVDYCLVGGLAVVAHCLSRGVEAYRATDDADAMVPQDYSNSDFARDYLRVYAADPTYGKAVYDAVFGEGGFEQLSDAEFAFVNASFVGADADLDGIDTPDFDVCRILNGRTLADVERERLEVLGQRIWVATVDELIGMKRETIAIYGPDFESSPRPQDFVDVGILDRLKGEGSSEACGAGGVGLLTRIGEMLGGR